MTTQTSLPNARHAWKPGPIETIFNRHLCRLETILADFEQFNFRLQGRRRNAQLGCGAKAASDFPVAVGECRLNDFGFLFMEPFGKRRTVAVGRYRGPG